MRKITLFKTILLAVILLAGYTQVQGEIIFAESLGTGGSGNLDPNIWEGYQNYGTLTFSGNGVDLRNNNNSTGYEDASGGRNVYVTNNVNAYFAISGINTYGYTDLGLTFGFFKGQAPPITSDDFVVEVATDYDVESNTGTFTALSYADFTIGQNVWGLVTITGGTIPISTTLTIRFRKVGGNNFRIDDIVLTGTQLSCTPPNFSFEESAVNKLINDATFTNAFTSDNTSPQVWSSSDTDVATVDSETGEVSIVGVGTTNISVSQLEDDTYCELNESYPLTVIILPTPTATDATNITKTSFTANWKALTGADEYEVHVAEVSGPVSGAVLANWTFEIQLEKKPSNASQKNIDREISLGGGAEFSASYAAGSGGSGTSAASATKWLDGADTKFWQITVNTVDFTNLTISFKQYSGPAAPKYFKVQYKANEEGDWTDVDGGAVTATDTWATGTVNNLALPAACENIENLFIRWLMISNEAVNGNDVTNNSVNRLDDIVITGNTTPISGSPFTVDGTETSLNIGGLDYETIYYYTVIAKNTFGESAASNEISVVTGPATSTARTELAESSVRVYNNQLMFHAKAGVSVEVYNITGQKVLHAYSQNNGQNILPLQAKGVLIVKIGTETNKIIVR